MRILGHRLEFDMKCHILHDFRTSTLFKGELQRENKLISCERVFKMLENDTYIAGIGHDRSRVIKL